MEQRMLGRTGLQVSVFGMGGLFVSRVGGNDREEARRAVQQALELGVNDVDTAPSDADSEAVLGYAMADAPTCFYLATKLGGRPQLFDAKDKQALRWLFEEILRIHGPDRPRQYDWWTDEAFHGPVQELLDELKVDRRSRCAPHRMGEGCPVIEGLA